MSTECKFHSTEAYRIKDCVKGSHQTLRRLVHHSARKPSDIAAVGTSQCKEAISHCGGWYITVQGSHQTLRRLVHHSARKPSDIAAVGTSQCKEAIRHCGGWYITVQLTAPRMKIFNIFIPDALNETCHLQ